MKRWSFDDEYLLDLVLEGKKKATCSVYDEEDKSYVGEENIITKDGKDICKIRINSVKIFKFKEAKEEDVIKEGEGDLDEWRNIHIDFFTMYYPDFDDEYLIEFIEFDVIEVYE